MSALPGWRGSWANVLERLPAGRGSNELVLTGTRVVSSPDQLLAAVQANPATWCDGTGEWEGGGVT